MTYNKFAILYDELMQDAPYDKWVQLLQQVLTFYQVKPESIVDLGCGTGENTWRLHAAGFAVSGVDLSGEMLTIAKDKADKHGFDIPFIMQDISNLAGFSETDVFFSFCDVINYITDDQALEQTFDKVYQQLTDRGIFIFDTHDYDYGKSQLAHHTFTDETDDVTYIWDCLEVEMDILMHELTFFKQIENQNLYEKFTETHYQKLYHDEYILKLLKNAGFTEIKVFADFKLQDLNMNKKYARKFFVAQK